MQYIWTDYPNIRTDYWKKIHLMSFPLITKLIPNENENLDMKK